MASDAGEAVYPGLWECGDCGEITDEAHYVQDRMTGQMRHCASAEGRTAIRDRCGWSSTYDGYQVPPIQCALRHGHHGSHNPQCHGFGSFSHRWGGAIPPYDPTTANTKSVGEERHG